jgi:hypothetical protein
MGGMEFNPRYHPPPMTTPSQPDIPLSRDYGEGVYRRRIRLLAEGDRVEAQLADDFHHFAVELRHDGERVLGIKGREIRIPWTTCASATALLARLDHIPLTRDLYEVARHTDARLQCTHLFDLAALAIAHAARQAAGNAATRQYDVALPDRGEDPTRARLERDSEPILAWQIEGLRIVAAEPEVFAGHKLAGVAFNRMVERNLEPELGEAALVLRRGIFIGIGRRYDFDRISRAETFAPMVGAACHTFNAANVGSATRVLGSVRDFREGAEGILTPGTEVDD